MEIKTDLKVWQSRYEAKKEELLNDNIICKENRKLFENFFEGHEYKLKRSNGLRALDAGTYRTLYGYTQKLAITNTWFKNKPWVELTKEDIKRVYDGLEDGKIKRHNGKAYSNLEDSYYSKVFKGKPFELAGKADLSREIIEYTKKESNEVRFIKEEDFRKLASNAYKPLHKLLFWLAWDIGENINAKLKLQKKHFRKQNNPHTKEPEYLVTLSREILKRSRKARTEPTNYKETVELLDQVLSGLKDENYLFDFDYGNAKKILNRAVDRAKAKCIPNGERLTWKDLRSSMACDLLSKGWTTDEVNARLGHRPSSKEIDKYVNFLAIDRHTPKKKIHQFQMSKLSEELEESKERERLQAMRTERMQEELEELKSNNGLVMKILKGLVQKGKIDDAVEIVHEGKLLKELKKLV